MIEELSNNSGDDQSQAERTEGQSLEKKRRMAMDELKTLMDEGLRLVANANDDASSDRLFEINRQERALIDRLGKIERDIATERGTK